MTTQISAGSVEQIMTTNVQIIDFNASVADALKLMTEDDYNSVPVVNGERQCVGILSRADMTEMLVEEDQELTGILEAGAFNRWTASFMETCSDKRVREFMTHDVTTVKSDASIKEACGLMATNKIHHLPVVDGNKTVVGIVSAFDIIGWVANQ